MFVAVGGLAAPNFPVTKKLHWHDFPKEKIRQCVGFLSANRKPNEKNCKVFTKSSTAPAAVSWGDVRSRRTLSLSAGRRMMQGYHQHCCARVSSRRPPLRGAVVAAQLKTGLLPKTQFFHPPPPSSRRQKKHSPSTLSRVKVVHRVASVASDNDSVRDVTEHVVHGDGCELVTKIPRLCVGGD